MGSDPWRHDFIDLFFCLTLISDWTATATAHEPPNTTMSVTNFTRLSEAVTTFEAVTGLVGPKSPLGLGVFSHASFAIQPRPRLRTLLDGAGPQAHGVALL